MAPPQPPELHDSSNSNQQINLESSREPSRENNDSGLNSQNSPTPLISNENNNESNSPSSPAPSIFKRVWNKLGINRTVAALMFKGALAPVIATAIYQSKSVADVYLNFGYLIIVVSILSVTILPRGKFMMNMSISVLLICFAMAMVLLGQWAGIKARQHNTPIGASPDVALGYNSSAAAVNAIFLMLNLFGINALRAARPAFSIPAVGYNIFVLLGFTYGPQMATVHNSLRFSKELFYAFLTGQAIGTGVSLLVVPISSRKVFFGEAAGFLQSCRGLLKAQIEFVEALECSQMECVPHPNTRFASGGGSETDDVRDNQPQESENRRLYNQRASSLKASSAALLALGGKLRDDLVFAKREIAFGHFQSKHIHKMHKLFMDILVPITGFSTVTEISQRLNDRLCTDMLEEFDSPTSARTQETQEGRESESEEWSGLIRPLHALLKPLVHILDDSILHILILLKFVPNPNRATSKRRESTNSVGRTGTTFNEDIEKGNDPVPGKIGFGDYLDETIDKYRAERSEVLKTWGADRGLRSIYRDSQEQAHLSPGTNQGVNGRHMSPRDERFSERLHLIFYMEYLMYSVSKAILAVVRCAESNVADGILTKRRFIFPSLKIVTKMVKGLIRGEDSNPGTDKVGSMGADVQTVSLGHSLQAPKNPEHLPPKNSWQAFGDRLRVIPKFFGSGHVKFGARVAIAAMSVGILAFLHNTHSFFIGQRVVWGLVMVCIGMSPTTGSAVFTLITNLATTAIATVAAFINWYIVGQNTAGIIVFLFIFMLIYFYFVVKFPRFLVALASGAITHVLIVGYELQVRVEGIKAATATGQVFYKTYLLAPYRLLAVGGGVIIAYVFTIFPVPITEGSVLRRDLGSSLYLLANYVSSTTSTVDHRLQDKEGDMSLASSPGRRLEKSRQDLLQKELALLNSMKRNLAFMAWGPNFGGDFPKEIYTSIIDEIQNIVNYLAVIGFASERFITVRQESPPPVWLFEFARSRPETSVEAQKSTSLLIHLSSSIRNGKPLPPYLEVPNDPHLAKQVHCDKADILTFQNLNEPAFRALAVIKLAQSCMVDSLSKIVAPVKELVGEVDFSYQIVDSNEQV